LKRAQDEHGSAAATELLVLRCAFDLELFAKRFFPHYCRHAFNPFHEQYFAEVQVGERKVRRSRGAPRGYAKSTLAALIKPIHDVCYGLEKFIVIFSNNQPNSNSKLKDIRSEILSNRRLVDTYGIGFPRKAVGETEYIVHCGDHQTMFKAVGKGVQVRGIRFGESRPSKLIFDDVEHSEEVLNEALRQKDENWFFEDCCRCGDENTNIEFIGTVLHPESLLVKLLNNPSYQSKLYRAVISWSEREDLWNDWKKIYTHLEDSERKEKAQAFYEANKEEMLKGTKVLWPEKEPYVDLMKERIEMGDRSFQKEKQNDPQGDSSKVFEHFHFYREEKEGVVIESTGKLIPWDQIKKLCYGAIDPATGKRGAKNPLGDFACLLIGYKDPFGRLLVHKDWTKREPPTKYIKQIFDYQLEYGLEKMGVETNLYKELLLPNIVAERERIQRETGKLIKIGFYEIDQTANKIERITAIEPKVTHGWILFNRGLSQEFMSQMRHFPGTHDDCPDTVEMLWNMVNNRYKASAVSVNAMGGR
jgi:predicted phage terminase large subunit-like protein